MVPRFEVATPHEPVLLPLTLASIRDSARFFSRISGDAFAAETRALLKALHRDHSYVRYSSPRPGDRSVVDLAE
jgi:hypothetical protein